MLIGLKVKMYKKGHKGRGSVSRSIKQEENRRKYIEKGLCSNCGRERENKEFILCGFCRESRRKSNLKKTSKTCSKT